MLDDEPPREIEAKFQVDEPGRLALLALNQLGSYVTRSRKQRVQDDTYFDTADAALAHAGATLRVRNMADGALMTYKGRREQHTADGEAHLANRSEDEAPLGAGQARRITLKDALPSDIVISPVLRARVTIGDAELFPVARLHTERAVIDLEDDAGNHLELAIDRCAGVRLRDGRRVEFDEIELEAKGSSRAALVEAQRVLRARVPSLRPSHITKLERVLGDG
jgi:inorganic triphosphatase YgiF